MMRDLVLAEPKAQHATETQLVNLYCIFPRNMHIGIESIASNKYAAWLKLYNPLFRMVA
jgi:hypothetical protein